MTIGFSTQEYQDWAYSIAIAYAKEARTFERHIDVPEEGHAVSPYCSTPDQADAWLRAFVKAKEMCGGVGSDPRAAASPRIRRMSGAESTSAPSRSSTTLRILTDLSSILLEDAVLWVH